MPITFLCPVSSWLTVITDSSRSLLKNTNQRPRVVCAIPLLFYADYGVPVKMAGAHHASNRNVPDECV